LKGVTLKVENEIRW